MRLKRTFGPTTEVSMTDETASPKPVTLWRGLVERGLGRAVIAPSRPVTDDDDCWQHPLPEDKFIRLQQVRRANLGNMGRIARQHCWW